ncbi:MAG: hypothetical protein ACREUT_06670 [Steroidobacteraceae bacterium]
MARPEAQTGQGLGPTTSFINALCCARERRLGLEVFLTDPDVLLDTSCRAFDIEDCIVHVHMLFPDFRPQFVETHVLSWLECGFVPKGLSEAQMD